MFKTTQNNSKLKILSAKLRIILLCSYTKPIYLQCLNSKSFKDCISLSYASVNTKWVSLKLHYSDLDLTNQTYRKNIGYDLKHSVRIIISYSLPDTEPPQYVAKHCKY